jgi:hypothetical protein
MDKPSNFYREVMSIDCSMIGHVVMETKDKLVVFGLGDDRFDILKTEIQSESGSRILIGLPLYEIARRYKRSRREALPKSKNHPDGAKPEERLNPLLNNKSVVTIDREHVGHIVGQTKNRIVVFGHYIYRFDIPKSEIHSIDGKNTVVLRMRYDSIFRYRVDRNIRLSASQSSKL